MGSKSSTVEYPLFVYGTLQPGCGNYERFLEGGVLRFSRGVTVEGRVYFAFPNGGYPVAKLDEEGTIKGTLVVMDAGYEGLHAAIEMEEGAGYVCKQVTATMPDGSTKNVFAFHYAFDPRGDLIEHGDWEEERIKRWDENRAVR